MTSHLLAACLLEVTPALDLLTVPQVMARLQLGRSAVYDLLRTGQFASITLSRTLGKPSAATTGPDDGDEPPLCAAPVR
ncbi:DNA-binding protein [Streptomyces sp. SID1034]|uniref:helix-turn-helix transcriptional regulator n=1 Tax=Streptomyces TaxID=1883 RepID=UPI001F2FDC99|nr:DNA-binding protein [Streptomyces sp. SID1034]